MKKVIIAILAAALSSTAAFAGPWSYSQIGPFGHYQDSDGAWYNTNRFGNTTYWSGFDANSQYHSGSFTRFGSNIYGFGN